MKKAAICVMQVAASFFIYRFHLAENIIEEQEDAQNIERKIQILELTHHHLDQYIAQDAEADAIGDAVAEHHRNHRDEGRERLGNILQLNLLERINHQYTHHYQGTTSQSALFFKTWAN